MSRYSGLFAKTATLLLIFASSVSGQYVAVAGLTGGINPTSGARPARQNINSFASSGAPWDLYIQGLAAFQAEDQSELLSYYQIAGIHGRPYAAWDNVNGPQGDYATGYCTHDSILFPVWHRPYLALFEKSLFSYVQKIAASYTGTNAATYQAAAASWRMPYWDWASSPQMPSSVTTPSIRITGPSGPLTMANPLYDYKFHPLSTTDFPPSAQDAPSSVVSAPTTYRDANSMGVSNEAYVNQQLMSAGLTQSTYDVFTRATAYQNFSTQANSGTSLESVHGTIHVTVGQGNGHMTYIPYSAFDPIFFLHHTNVDRLFAMWQAIYPDQYVTPQVNNYGTFTEGGGTLEDQNTNLTPFTSTTNGSAFWTAANSRDLKSFGYTYPEIQDWNQTPAQLQASVRTAVNNLYNPGGTTTSRRKASSRPGPRPGPRPSFRSGFRPDSRTGLRTGSRVGGRGTPQFIRSESELTTTQWFATIAVDKYAVGGPFKIFLFIGPPPSDATAWSTAINLVGVQGYFTPVAPVGSKEPFLTHSELNLKKSFNLPSTGVQDTAADTAIPFLSKYLQWGVQNVHGTVVPNSDIPSLNIQVQQQQVDEATDDASFPTFGTSTTHPEITRGKTGGA